MHDSFHLFLNLILIKK